MRDDSISNSEVGYVITELRDLSDNVVGEDGWETVSDEEAAISRLLVMGIETGDSHFDLDLIQLRLGNRLVGGQEDWLANLRDHYGFLRGRHC